MAVQDTGQLVSMEDLVRMHLPALRGYLASLGAHTDLIDDLAQDVFLEVLKSVDRYDESRPFRSWLFGIARNLVKQEFRKSRMEARMRGGLTTSVIAEHRVTTGQETSEVASLEALHALRLCLEKLPGRTREMVTQRFEGRQRSDDIAGALGLTGSAVRTTLMRARSALRQCLETRLTESRIMKALA